MCIELFTIKSKRALIKTTITGLCFKAKLLAMSFIHLLLNLLLNILSQVYFYHFTQKRQ